MNILLGILLESWHLLQEASIYILFGILVGGMLRVFLSPGTVARNLGRGRFTSVFKAAFLGIPIPLCSCGVLPAAASLRKQGANKGATTAFVISAPETGVDSIALTYALLDPVMTVARPAAAFATAAAAGIAENIRKGEDNDVTPIPDISCPVDRCCDGLDCPPEVHASHHTFWEKVRAGVRYALEDIWGDIAVWFLVGLLLAGLITTVIPAGIITRHLGGGIPAMLIMLAAGIPLYICATASTPVAAALILKGVSPGAALVFLLAGPATNITSITMLLKILGKRATAIYLATIAVSAVVFGLVLDEVYSVLGISAQAVAGKSTEVIPYWLGIGGALVLLALSIRPVYATIRSRLTPKKQTVQGEVCCHPSHLNHHANHAFTRIEHQDIPCQGPT
jgi:uncharacterized membrane protein YraQ (UPF0718 family)